MDSSEDFSSDHDNDSGDSIQVEKKDKRKIEEESEDSDSSDEVTSGHDMKKKPSNKEPKDKKEKKKKKKKSRKPSNSAFKQQRLKACQPILTPIPVITTLFIIGIVFIPVGIVMVISSDKVVEYVERYDDCGSIAKNCTITIDVDTKMENPVYLYYKLTNYYQNHRRYVKSRNDAQLRGDIITSYSDLEDCDPMKSKDDSEDEKDFYIPCGLIAWSFFNDTFALRNVEKNEYVPLKKEGIAWRSDVDKKFRNPEHSDGIRVIKDFEDEDFIVWMRTAALPSFKKLYRIIEQDIPEGKYEIQIQNNYPVDDFDGEKYIVLSTVSWMGGKNPFLGYSYIVVGAICIILSIAFLLRHLIKPRKLGDEKYLQWNKH